MVNDNPPSYKDSIIATPPKKDVPVKERNVGEPECYDANHFQGNQQEERVPLMQAGPSYLPGQVPTMHYYVSPVTGEQVVSPLPPTHPEMICLQEGAHIRRTKFGLLGVLAAVFWFPLGIGLCLLDRRVTCDRCGRTIEDGILCG